MPAEDSNRDPRVYLAAERTFLAWIRTSLALMGFGFVVARFGLFLRELGMVRGDSPSESSALSPPLGIAFVLIGVISIVLAAWRHVRYIEELNRGSLNVGRPSRMAIVLALILAAAGLVMAFYLGTTSARQPAPSVIEKGRSSMKTGGEVVGENGASDPRRKSRDAIAFDPKSPPFIPKRYRDGEVIAKNAKDGAPSGSVVGRCDRGNLSTD